MTWDTERVVSLKSCAERFWPDNIYFGDSAESALPRGFALFCALRVGPAVHLFLIDELRGGFPPLD